MPLAWSRSRFRIPPQYTILLLAHFMATEADIRKFIDRQYTLLDTERDAEIERTSLLISSCSQKLLEQKGLALGGLGVASVAVGLGGKR